MYTARWLLVFQSILLSFQWPDNPEDEVDLKDTEINKVVWLDLVHNRIK
jgi:hypothetical protein